MTRPHFLFPSTVLKPTAVDEAFADQAAALRAAGFTASAYPDPAVHGDKLPRNVPAGATVVYRGWMMNAAAYAGFEDAVRRADATPLVPSATYLATHHLPNWYPLLIDLTPETRVLPTTADFKAELAALSWPAYFVKDYVKSLKTPPGAVVSNASELRRLLAAMERERGEIEGGVCLRRVEDFVADSERRYFVLHGRPFAAAGGAVPGIVGDVAERVAAPFYSVDVIRRRDGSLRVVEIGDGQVSDLVGWTAGAFAAMWASAANSAQAFTPSPPCPRAGRA